MDENITEQKGDAPLGTAERVEVTKLDAPLETAERVEVPIKGVQKQSLADYPDKVCAIAFLPGCTFKCPYCHNPELITSPEKLPTMKEDEFIQFIKGRGKWLDGVCISGGEPMIHQGLPGFIKKINDAGFLVKLDTNGSNPRMLRDVLSSGNVDYVAMDIKSSLPRYAEATNSPVDLRKIEESVQIIRASGINYEFRTTVLPKLVSREDIIKIGEWLKGSKRFAIQQFRSNKTLDPSYANEPQYSDDELIELKKLASPYFEEVLVR